MASTNENDLFSATMTILKKILFETGQKIGHYPISVYHYSGIGSMYRLHTPTLPKNVCCEENCNMDCVWFKYTIHMQVKQQWNSDLILEKDLVLFKQLYDNIVDKFSPQ